MINELKRETCLEQEVGILEKQLEEANELLHYVFDLFYDENDSNEITDYFDKWGV